MALKRASMMHKRNANVHGAKENSMYLTAMFLFKSMFPLDPTNLFYWRHLIYIYTIYVYIMFVRSWV